MKNGKARQNGFCVEVRVLFTRFAGTRVVIILRLATPRRSSPAADPISAADPLPLLVYRRHHHCHRTSSCPFAVAPSGERERENPFTVTLFLVYYREQEERERTEETVRDAQTVESSRTRGGGGARGACGSGCAAQDEADVRTPVSAYENSLPLLLLLLLRRRWCSCCSHAKIRETGVGRQAV